MLKDVWFVASNGAKVSKNDKKYFVEKPDKDFSPEKNAAVIKKTIEDAHRREALAWSRIQDGLGERAEAVAMFLKSKKANTYHVSDKVMVDYFGKKQLVSLTGGRILQKLKKYSEFKNAA